jgi:hypothetical protein
MLLIPESSDQLLESVASVLSTIMPQEVLPFDGLRRAVARSDSQPALWIHNP